MFLASVFELPGASLRSVFELPNVFLASVFLNAAECV